MSKNVFKWHPSHPDATHIGIGGSLGVRNGVPAADTTYVAHPPVGPGLPIRVVNGTPVYGKKGR